MRPAQLGGARLIEGNVPVGAQTENAKVKTALTGDYLVVIVLIPGAKTAFLREIGLLVEIGLQKIVKGLIFVHVYVIVQSEAFGLGPVQGACVRPFGEDLITADRRAPGRQSEVAVWLDFELPGNRLRHIEAHCVV